MMLVIVQVIKGLLGIFGEEEIVVGQHFKLLKIIINLPGELNCALEFQIGGLEENFSLLFFYSILPM